MNLLLLLICLLTGCSYNWTLDPQEKHQLFIPFVRGDEDGTLTSAITQALSTSGFINTSEGESAYRLDIRVLETKNQTIGYRRNSQKTQGKISNNIVPCEGRKSIVLEVSILDIASHQPLHGPCLISSDSDYDFIDGDSVEDLLFTNSAGISTPVLPFSLGQLEPVEAAQEASNRPLNQRLARKVSEYVLSVFLEKSEGRLRLNHVGEKMLQDSQHVTGSVINPMRCENNLEPSLIPLVESDQDVRDRDLVH